MSPFPANSSFSSNVPGLQIAWDSTSLSAFKECPRKYYYSIIHGWAPRQESVHLTFGILYHQALERYDHARAEGVAHDRAVILTTRWMLTATWNKELRRPWNSDDKNKNRYTLVRTVIWYLEQFKDDPAKTIILANGKPAVELSFRFELDFSAPTNQNYLLCGHLDRLADVYDGIYVLDKKTSKNSIESPDYFDRYSPDNQMSLYDYAANVVYQKPVKGVIVDAAQVMVTFSRFRRGFAYRTQAMRDEWYENLKLWIDQAARYAMAQFWPMNDKSCGLYGGCPFRPICGKDPNVREQWLAAGFKKRIWDPLQTRGDI